MAEGHGRRRTETVDPRGAGEFGGGVSVEDGDGGG